MMILAYEELGSITITALTLIKMQIYHFQSLINSMNEERSED